MDAERGTAHRAKGDYSPEPGFLTVEERAEEGHQLVAEVVPLERQADVRLEVAGDLPGVVVVALELERNDLAVGDRAPDRIGELEPAAGSRLGRVEGPEDVVGEHVAAEDGKVGGGFADGRLLDQVGDLVHPS